MSKNCIQCVENTRTGIDLLCDKCRASGSAQRMVRERLYVASKTTHAARWRELRARGVLVVASWIDEAGEGESADYADLATRCIEEAASADATLLYCEPGEVLKGALVEVGAALAAGKQVRCVGDCGSISRVFKKHPLWREYPSIEAAALYNNVSTTEKP